MASKAEILRELDTVTDRLSSQVRTTAVGVLATTWGLLVSDSPVAKDISRALSIWLVPLGVAAIMVLFLDFLQYLAGFINTQTVLRAMEAQHAEDGQYDYTSLSWRLRLFFFWAKQVVLIVTVVLLFVVFVCWLLQTK